MINFHKSCIFFSPNCPSQNRAQVSSILGLHHPLDHGRYIGLPFLIGQNKKQVFSFLKYRVWKRVRSWNRKFLSRAGKKILLKLVARAIPSYVMSIFAILVSLGEELERMMNSFWWDSNGHQEENSLVIMAKDVSE